VWFVKNTARCSRVSHSDVAPVHTGNGTIDVESCQDVLNYLYGIMAAPLMRFSRGVELFIPARWTQSIILRSYYPIAGSIFVLSKVSCCPRKRFCFPLQVYIFMACAVMLPAGEPSLTECLHAFDPSDLTLLTPARAVAAFPLRLTIQGRPHVFGMERMWHHSM
jgi:hypothetical protein